jgi:hypothetical protein
VKRESCIWVLVAGRNEARIYSSADGVYELGATMPQSVADVLRAGAREGAYDGLIVVAPQDVLRVLKRELGPEMAPLVIGEIAGPAAAAATQRFLTPQWIQ